MQARGDDTVILDDQDGLSSSTIKMVLPVMRVHLQFLPVAELQRKTGPIGAVEFDLAAQLVLSQHAHQP